MEKWKDICGFSNYEISDLGRLRNKSTMNILNGCFKSGYLQTSIKNDSGRKITKSIHRLVALAFIDNPLFKEEVNHIDGNKMNNAVCNLEWVTPKENITHAFSYGLIKAQCGEKHGRSKLSDSDVLEIRRLLSIGKEGKEIARMFNVTTATISLINTRKKWKHLL